MIATIAAAAAMLFGAAPALQVAGATPVSPVTVAGAPPATATPAAPAAEVVGFKGRVGKNGLVCSNDPVLGSRMPVRRCRTPADIAARRVQDQQTLDLMQRLNDPGSSMKPGG